MWFFYLADEAHPSGRSGDTCVDPATDVSLTNDVSRLLPSKSLSALREQKGTNTLMLFSGGFTFRTSVISPPRCEQLVSSAHLHVPCCPHQGSFSEVLL